MTLSDRYRRLARLIDALESQGLTVRSATPAGELPSGESSGEQLPVRLELELPSGATLDRLIETSPERVATAVDDTEQDVSPSSTPERTTADTSDPDRPTASAAEDDDVDVTEADAPHDAPDETAAEATDDTTPDGSDDAEPVAEADETDAAAEEEPTDETPTESVSCTHPDCDRTFETDRGMKIHRTKAHSLSELIDSGTDEAVHCDPEVLADVYEQYDTFAEMTDALDVDVGPQAVRKQMIRHDIHEPGIANVSPSSTDSSTADADTGEPPSESVADGGSVVVADVDAGVATNGSAETDATEESADANASTPDATNGVSASESEATEEDGADDAEPTELGSLPDLDLPASLSADEFRVAVEDATTLYDVQRALDLDRETTRDLLREYDLLELVCGRAATVSEREELKTEIHERLQRAAT